MCVCVCVCEASRDRRVGLTGLLLREVSRERCAIISCLAVKVGSSVSGIEVCVCGGAIK